MHEFTGQARLSNRAANDFSSKNDESIPTVFMYMYYALTELQTYASLTVYMF